MMIAYSLCIYVFSIISIGKIANVQNMFHGNGFSTIWLVMLQKMIDFLENINWEGIIAQYRPFCNFSWCFGAKRYYTLDDNTSTFSDLEQYFS